MRISIGHIGRANPLKSEETMYNWMLAVRGVGLIIFSIFFISCGGEQKANLPGEIGENLTLLPNRWMLAPAGRQVPVGDLPLRIVLTPDSRYLAVTNNGYGEQYISIIDVETRQEIQKLSRDKLFLGLASSGDGKTLYASGGGSNRIFIYTFTDGSFSLSDSIVLGENKVDLPLYPAGIAVTPDGERLLAVTNLGNELLSIDLPLKKVTARHPVGEYPYTVVISPDGRNAAVSNWGSGSVSVFDLGKNSLIETIPCGSHPNDMIFSPDGKRLYVANANTDNVSVIDMELRQVIRTIDLAPYHEAPAGSTPNGLALSGDGGTLFVANATNNDVSVIDIQLDPPVLKGQIPVGWYPTALAVDASRNILLAANAKGLHSLPNPKGPQPNASSTPETQYIGGLFTGTVSFIDIPGDKELENYTEEVKRNNLHPVEGKEGNTPASGDISSVIPRHPGEPSKIKYVVYIIKENRTYDQVFGDLPQGNGDSSLTLFGRNITPNHHALTETYTLFDNFYVDSEVSADGHEWSMGAIATDFVEKMWPLVYSGRRVGFPAEGNFEIAFPDAGYLWDAAARAGISYRSYGEFVHLDEKIKRNEDGSFNIKTLMKNLNNHYSPTYCPWDLNYTDVDRVAAYKEELKGFERDGDFPQLQILRLPNDHTIGTSPGGPTPRAMVADNDLALGMIIEAISHSRFWNETAIFVLEDDSQNGPDHVDCHRSIALVLSPYVKRGFIDHTMYDTVCMLKTMELILGLEPMSQYDAAAIPLLNCFTAEPDFTPYTCLPNSWPLDEKNMADAFGAEESLAMNFVDVDLAPEQPLNEIVWKSIKGRESVMPKPFTRRKWIEK